MHFYMRHRLSLLYFTILSVFVYTTPGCLGKIYGSVQMEDESVGGGTAEITQTFQKSQDK